MNFHSSISGILMSLGVSVIFYRTDSDYHDWYLVIVLSVLLSTISFGSGHCTFSHCRINTIYIHSRKKKGFILYSLKNRPKKIAKGSLFLPVLNSSQKYILYFPTICIFNTDMIYYIYIFLHLLMKITVPIW